MAGTHELPFNLSRPASEQVAPQSEETDQTERRRSNAHVLAQMGTSEYLTVLPVKPTQED